jgi:hypothetical protein
MKRHVIVIATLIVASTALLVFERARRLELRGALEAMVSERNALEIQLKDLIRQTSEEKSRDVVSSPVPLLDAPVISPAPLPLPPREEAVATPGVSINAPGGWFKNGSNTGAYIVGVDSVQMREGMPSGYVRSNGASEQDFGGMMQMTSAENLLGQRLRLRGWIKTENADDGGGHLWMRVDGYQAGATLQFDNMDNRSAMGTTDWKQYSVVLDVPPNAYALAFGFFLKGRGRMWVSGTTIDVVGAEVASTNRVVVQPKVATRSALPKHPLNLGFDPHHPK